MAATAEQRSETKRRDVTPMKGGTSSLSSVVVCRSLKRREDMIMGQLQLGRDM